MQKIILKIIFNFIHVAILEFITEDANKEEKYTGYGFLPKIMMKC